MTQSRPNRPPAYPPDEAASWRPKLELVPLNGASSWEALAALSTKASAGVSAHPYYASRSVHGDIPSFVKAPSALKFICLIEKSPNISPSEFHEHWLQNHSRLVFSFRKALRIRRYVQSHVIASPTVEAFGQGRDCTPNPYTGLTECWWDSEQDMAAAFVSEEGQKAGAALAEDERKMGDSRIVLWAAREYEIFSFDTL